MDNTTIYKTTDEANQSQRTRVAIPFDELTPGQSVFRHENEIKEASLRSMISSVNLKYENKYFGVHKHKELKTCEIYCRAKITSRVDAEAANPEIVESSPEAKLITDSGLSGKKCYPFFELTEGMSFIIPIGANAEKIEKSMRVACCVQSKKLGKRFVLLKHEKYSMFEVYCVPCKPLQFFQPSAEMQEKVSDYENASKD